MPTYARPKVTPSGIIVLVLVVSLIGCLPAAWAGALVKSVDMIGMTVANMDRSVEFFSKVLSFEKISNLEVTGSDYERFHGIVGARLRIARMRLGDEIVELTEYLTPRGRPIAADSRSHDHWFQHIAIVVGDMDKAYQRLRAHNVKHTSVAPQRIPDSNKAAAGIRAFYFKDPDGHDLELIYFPAGKGKPKWRRINGRLFLGIDHTAITVSDTQRSLQFYRDILGMELAGESENHGIEQDRLNNLSGSRVRISGLKAENGPGVEFLHYLAPAGGRPMPADTRANDLWHWQTAMKVNQTGAAAEKLKAASIRFVSSAVAKTPDLPSEIHKAFVVRDPDGHGVRLFEQ